jgi:hypothetical protein
MMVGTDEGTLERRYRNEADAPRRRSPHSRRISIAENDNDGDAWRILLGPRRATVVDGSEQAAGAVAYDGKNTVVTDAANRVRFTKATPALEPAYGVLLIDRIPVRERYIIVAELLARGR